MDDQALPRAMMSLTAAREHADRVRNALPMSHAEHALLALDDAMGRPVSEGFSRRKLRAILRALDVQIERAERGEAITLDDLIVVRVTQR